MKRNYRFALFQARLPDIYDEAEAKIQAGIKPADVIIDFLIELHWRRQLQTGQGQMNNPPEIDNPNGVTDFDEAMNIMDNLL